MVWTISFEEQAAKELSKLDPQIARRILLFLSTRIAPLDDPRVLGDPLKGSELGEFWRYRVGDWRVIVLIEDEELRVLVVRLGHRRHVYERH
ncbi:MAG: type II toxin-antitoxin system RelE/ParE family toxin [Lautropia sp.]|nr:type II toxin-antitoxin system RelE/ParE family toxin [Lautropia sp.]